MKHIKKLAIGTLITLQACAYNPVIDTAGRIDKFKNKYKQFEK